MRIIVTSAWKLLKSLGSCLPSKFSYRTWNDHKDAHVLSLRHFPMRQIEVRFRAFLCLALTSAACQWPGVMLTSGISLNQNVYLTKGICTVIQFHGRHPMFSFTYGVSLRLHSLRLIPTPTQSQTGMLRRKPYVQVNRGDMGNGDSLSHSSSVTRFV